MQNNFFKLSEGSLVCFLKKKYKTLQQPVSGRFHIFQSNAKEVQFDKPISIATVYRGSPSFPDDLIFFLKLTDDLIFFRSPCLCKGDS